MRLRLKPGFRRVWRDPGTLQIGLSRRRGTVITGLALQDIPLLEALRHGIDAAAPSGLTAYGDPGRGRALVRVLAEAGVLAASGPATPEPGRLGQAAARLAPDAAVWSVVHPRSGDGWPVLAARAARVVLVHGAGRLGSTLCATLAAAGVGTVLVRDAGRVTAADLAPAGAGLPDLGRTRQSVGQDIVRRAGGHPQLRARTPGRPTSPTGGPAPTRPTASRAGQGASPHTSSTAGTSHQPPGATGERRPTDSASPLPGQSGPDVPPPHPSSLTGAYPHPAGPHPHLGNPVEPPSSSNRSVGIPTRLSPSDGAPPHPSNPTVTPLRLSNSDGAPLHPSNPTVIPLYPSPSDGAPPHPSDPTVTPLHLSNGASFSSLPSSPPGLQPRSANSANACSDLAGLAHPRPHPSLSAAVAYSADPTWPTPAPAPDEPQRQSKPESQGAPSPQQQSSQQQSLPRESPRQQPPHRQSPRQQPSPPPEPTRRPSAARRPATAHQPDGTFDAELAGADLVVLVSHGIADAARADYLMSADVPHLAVVVGEDGVVVGPLVRPGRSPCLRCLDLHRRDRDPDWPRVLAQLPEQAGGEHEETASASLAAGLAALQVLAELDGMSEPAALGATLEVELPDGLIARRPWRMHPACGCAWPTPTAERSVRGGA